MCDYESSDRQRLRALQDRLAKIRDQQQALGRAELAIIGAMAELRRVMRRYKED